MKIASDNSDIEVIVTRGVDGRPPNIWLQWIGRSDRLATPRTMIALITIDEARELAQTLLLKADSAREKE